MQDYWRPTSDIQRLWVFVNVRKVERALKVWRRICSDDGLILFHSYHVSQLLPLVGLLALAAFQRAWIICWFSGVSSIELLVRCKAYSLNCPNDRKQEAQFQDHYSIGVPCCLYESQPRPKVLSFGADASTPSFPTVFDGLAPDVAILVLKSLSKSSFKWKDSCNLRTWGKLSGIHFAKTTSMLTI